MTDPTDGGAPIVAETPTTAYPRLFRVFVGSLVAAVVSGFVAIAIQGTKGLHPAPFLVLATLCAAAGVLAFVIMLLHLLGALMLSWWKR